MCEARFQGVTKRYRTGRKRAIVERERGPVCALSYTDAGGFQSCRGLRMRGACPRGYNYEKVKVDGDARAGCEA